MTETFINHCITLYNALDGVATDKKLESGGIARVFVGSYTDVWKSTKIPQTYYSPIRISLAKHHAIDILQKGTKNTDTVIVLRGLPETWDIDGWRDDKGLTKSSRHAMLMADVQDLKKSLGGINVLMALQEFEKRLIKLENSSSRIEQNLSNIAVEVKLLVHKNKEN
jgi:hypothetical protein